MRGMTLERRRLLLCLTAASGSISNLEIAITSTGCLPTCEIAASAAEARQFAACEWLQQQGCVLDDIYRGPLAAAARGGHKDVCEQLLARGCRWNRHAVREAARNGHMELAEWLLEREPQCCGTCAHDPWDLLAPVAEGCGLASLQRLWLSWPGRLRREEHMRKVIVLAAAAGSPTPDWRAKVEWLEARGCPRTEGVVDEGLVERTDALERLAWLRQRGYPLTEARAVKAAAAVGNVPVLRFLLDHGAPAPRHTVAEAAGEGRLAVLQLLHGGGYPNGCRLPTAEDALVHAAWGGHLAVVAWLVEEVPGAAERLDGRVFRAAAGSGSVELMAWLRARGCPWDESAFTAAARAGCEAALEWLVERGCPMRADGQPYTDAGRNGDLATLRCLARLGCPWGPRGRCPQAPQ